MSENFHLFLDHTRHLPKDAPVSININCSGGGVLRGTLQELRDIFLRAWVEVPVLQKNLEDALIAVRKANKQIVPEPMTSPRPMWEYRALSFNPAMDYIAKFNQLGHEGWELVFNDFADAHAIFKRAL